MNILLTGSTGFLGKILADELRSCSNLFTLSRNNAYYNYKLDTQIPNFNRTFNLVIHSAGKAHFVPKSEKDACEIFNINVNGTLNLLTGLSKSKLPNNFVYISSVSVYGLIEGINISESNPLMALDPYGKSKIEAELLVKKWCKENNVTCTILRLPLIIGVNPPGNFGSMIRGIRKGYYFNIAGGNAKKSMVLATDIAKHILKAAEVGGTYNLTDGFHPSVKDLSKSISQIIGKPFVLNMPLFIAKVLAIASDIFGNVLPINSDKLLKIISTLTFDDSKARISFGWEPTPVIEELKLYKNV